jgi:hypothetical protein
MDQLVLVRWDDIVEDSAWTSRQELDKHTVAKIETVGWILEDTEATLKLCTSRDREETDMIGGIVVIPKGVVRSVSRLSLG